MPRRCNDSSSDEGPPKKKSCGIPEMHSFDLNHGEYLRDVAGKQWKLGKAVGLGGFGQIYLASDNLSKEVKTDSSYVAKVESHKSGPLFVEVNCYLRIAKPDMINEWKKQKKLNSLGMPHYVASGSHMHKGERYRFLILPKFNKDLEKIIQEKKILTLKTVLKISSQIIDVLEYIHSKGYIHSDIKASNILLNNEETRKKRQLHNNQLEQRLPICNPIRTCRISKEIRSTRNLRPKAFVNYVDDIPNFEELFLFKHSNDEEPEQKPETDQVYLLDYGLTSKFLMSSGEHKPYCIDERKAHAGTVLFCSRDAHKGVPSRRSDLESLGYNMIYWLTGNLPWSSDIDNPEVVDKKKQRFMNNIEYFLSACFLDYPKVLLDYFKYLQNLQFQEKPDYDYCKNLFQQVIKVGSYKNDSSLDVDAVCKQTKVRRKVSENLKVQRFVNKIPRPPLQSNIPVKPLLRRKVKNNKVKKKSKWFIVEDPEVILKQGREKKNTENDTNFAANITEMNIDRLNPTYAMIKIYNKCRDGRDTSPSYKGDCCQENINGYTQAMMSVLNKIRKRNERELLAVSFTDTKNGKTFKRPNSQRKKKLESPSASLPQTRTSKSATMMKKEHFQARKMKSFPLRRTYSLRG